MLVTDYPIFSMGICNAELHGNLMGIFLQVSNQLFPHHFSSLPKSNTLWHLMENKYLSPPRQKFNCQILLPLQRSRELAPPIRC